MSLDLDFGNWGELVCTHVFSEKQCSVVCICFLVVRESLLTSNYHCFIRQMQFSFSNFNMLLKHNIYVWL